MIEHALVDYYRCPDEFANISVAGELNARSGYFRVGSSVCYGQTAGSPPATMATDDLQDLLPDFSTEDGQLRVPFDVSQVVDNLRLERYWAERSRIDPLRETFWHRPYYSVRRFLPARLRRRLQEGYFRDWKTLSFPRWPVDDSVDQLLERLILLSLRVKGVTRMPFVWFWPDGAPSCAIVTHDVETLAGRDRCSWLMDIDDEYQLKSSFQLVPEDRYSISPAFLDEIRSRGFEINVHDLNHDGRLFSNHQEFLRRANRINGYLQEFGARGFRSGSLYRRPDWYHALGIAYDMSIPNAAHLEVQRGGCCTVMPYFIGRILELPFTTTQDHSLFHILKDFSNGVWKSQIESVMARHGLLSFLVHPDYLGVAPAQQAYRVLLDEVARLREAGRCWVALPGDVERWWRARSQTTLVRDGSGWRIEGPGKGRARIAYAEIHGDELSYTIAPASAASADTGKR